MTAPPCELLAWDSKFFGIRIGRVLTETLDDASCQSALRWCREHTVKCLYFLAEQDQATITTAEQNGFHLVDIRVDLDRDLANSTSAAESLQGDGETSDQRIRTAAASDLPRLRELAAAGHRNTRFYQDEHFPRELCDELYRTWIAQSLGPMASAVFVATDEEGISGYVTVVIEGDSSRIGLIAVDPAARGRGHGSRLVQAAIDHASKYGASQMRVATQSVNIDALRLYERRGFRVGRVGLWYHRWFDL